MKSNSTQKEKGTLKVPNSNSVKNQAQFTKKNHSFKDTSLTLVNKLIIELEKSLAFQVDDHSIRWINSILGKLKHLKRTILIDPRFKWTQAQNLIDLLYLEDNQIKIFTIEIDIKELKNNPEKYIPNVRGF